MNRRKTEIKWVNIKVQEKRREKAFIEELKAFEPKLYAYQLCCNFIQGKFAQQHHTNISSYKNF